MGVRSSLNKIYDLLSKHLPSNAMRIGCQRAKGVRVGGNVYLAYDVNIDLVYPELVEIGDNVRIGIGVIILAHNRPSDAWLPHLGQVQERVRIERNAVISPAPSSCQGSRWGSVPSSERGQSSTKMFHLSVW